MSSLNLDHLALLKFGIAVSPHQREEVIKLIKSNSTYKDDFEKVKTTISTMVDEDLFLEVPLLLFRPSSALIPKSQKSLKTAKSSSTGITPTISARLIPTKFTQPQSAPSSTPTVWIELS